MKYTLSRLCFAYSWCWQASVSRVRLGRTVNQRSVGKARERWHEQGGTWGLVAGLYWCVGLLLPMDGKYKLHGNKT
jgi:hypothetical protein